MLDRTLIHNAGLRRVSVAASLLLVTAAVFAAAAAPGITHEDLWLMKRLGATATSPDGRWIVVAVADPSYDEERKSSNLWIVPADGSAPPRPLTAGKAAEGDPAWSEDSTQLAFSSKREGDDEAQVYVLPVGGVGEARRVTNAVTGATAPRFSPDGRAILFTSRVYPGTAGDEDNRTQAAERKARKYNVRAYDSFPLRHWDRWLDEREPTLMVQALSGDAPPRDVLGGTAFRAQRGFGGRLGNEGETIDAAWAPDGRSIVFAATVNRDQGARAEIVHSLWQVAVDGGEPRRLTAPTADYAAPEFTHDGTALLAKVEAADTRYVFNATGLARWDWPAMGEPRFLTAGFDRNVGSFAVMPDDRRVYFTAESDGLEKLFAVPLAGGEVIEIGKLEAGTFTRLSVGGTAAAPVIAALWGSAVNPAELGRIDAGNGRWSALSAFNTDAAARLGWQPVETFWFESKRGVRIHNMLVRPPGFDPAQRYPLFVLIHGGPHTMWRDEITLRWNYHLLAKPGYVVLLTNYSGSTGFGEAFARRIQGDPLKGPADEINAAADEAVRRFPFIDGARRAAGGASYGGHLTNWLAVSTDHYRALVSHAGLFDLRTQWLSSDTVYMRERNLGGPAWDDGKVWREQSPLYRAEQLKTPILLSFGERDYRVPVNNGIEFWSVLQRQQVPSRLIVFPDENHWILKGENSRHFYGEVHAWLAKYL